MLFVKTMLKILRKFQVVDLICTSEPPPHPSESHRPQEGCEVCCHLLAQHMGCNICSDTRGAATAAGRRDQEQTVSPFRRCWTGLNPTCSVCRTHILATHTRSTHTTGRQTDTMGRTNSFKFLLPFALYPRRYKNDSSA